MNREEILKMPAGREMDTLVAESLGLVKNVGTPLELILPFSTNLLAAFEVVEKMHQNEYQYTLRGHFMGVEQHVATFDNQDWADANPLYKAHGNTAAHAICRAALLAVVPVTEGGV